jgi:hypothetical protein
MKTMDKVAFRKWSKLKWRDPQTDLYNLGRLQAQLAESGLSPTVADLRKRDLRQYLEWRQAALFSHCISEGVLGVPVAYCLVEDEDYDCVVRWRVEGTEHFAPVQLKEVVPVDLNPAADLNKELAKLQKYASASNTVVAVHLNQSQRLEFASIKPPKTGCSEVWIYGSASEDQSKWFVYGDILKQPRGYEVSYPAQPRAAADGRAFGATSLATPPARRG